MLFTIIDPKNNTLELDSSKPVELIEKELKDWLGGSGQDFWIFNQEDFCPFEFAPNSKIEYIHKICELIDEHGDLGKVVLDACKGDIGTTLEMLDRYVGTYECVEDYLKDYLEECIPKFLYPFIDWYAVGDLFEEDQITCIHTENCVYIFNQEL